MAKAEQVLVLDPAVELHFKGPFTDVVTSYLKLTNPSDQAVCFKVKTTAPKKYCVRPNSGIIEPKKVVSVAVMLQPFDYNPNEKNKHKFMVQTLFLPNGEGAAMLDRLWRDAKPESLMDSKLRCVFDMPSEISQNNNLDSNAIPSEELKTNVSKNVPETTVKASPKVTNTEAEVRKVVDDNKRLKDELRQLKQENAQLKEEGLRLRMCSNSAGESVNKASSSQLGAANPGQKESLQSSWAAYGGEKMVETPQSPMLYLAAMLTIGLLGIFIGKFIV